MERIKISVVMPSYNVVDYIDECIESVLNQTIIGIEIICIDAGSTDGTWEHLKKYKENAKYTEKITLIRSDKKSYGYQVNLGIRQARGEYIGIVETDDYIAEDMYYSLYEASENEKLDYIKANYCKFWTTKQNERVFWTEKVLGKNEINYEDILSAKEIARIHQYDTSVWNGIYNKEFLVKHNIKFNETAGAAYQDIGFLQQVNWYASSAKYLDKTLYYYCIDRCGSSANSGRGLIYSYQEYLFLLSHDIEKIKEIGEDLTLIPRMKAVFLENIKSVDLDNCTSEEEQCVKWFLSKFKELGVNIDENMIKNQYKKTLDYDNKKKDNIDFVRNKRVIVFGAGLKGKQCYQVLDSNDVCVIGFADNNAKICGEKIGSVWVKEVNAYIGDDYVWVIANKYHGEDMKKQLSELGINEKNIMLWE